jgi:cell division protein FtsB
MIKKAWEKLSHVLKNKYLLSLTLFSVWIIFFDDNNLIIRSGMIKNVNQLEKDCEYYKNRIITDSIKLNELKSSPEMLEKFAREQYLMKRDNEEIFIFVEE